VKTKKFIIIRNMELKGLYRCGRMIREKDIQKAKKEIDTFKRRKKTLEKDLIQILETCQTCPDLPRETLERKEMYFWSLKKRLLEMEENLKVLNGEREPEKIKPWKVRRPSDELNLMIFCK
jgi:hypothetical protein